MTVQAATPKATPCRPGSADLVPGHHPHRHTLAGRVAQGVGGVGSHPFPQYHRGNQLQIRRQNAVDQRLLARVTTNTG
jgi:hypothetical protein